MAARRHDRPRERMYIQCDPPPREEEAESIMTERVADVLWSMLAAAGLKRCYRIVGDALNPNAVGMSGLLGWGGAYEATTRSPRSSRPSNTTPTSSRRPWQMPRKPRRAPDH